MYIYIQKKIKELLRKKEFYLTTVAKFATVSTFDL